MMRKFFKYLGRTVLAILLLLFFLVFLLYLPPFQRFLKDKAVNYITSHYGLAVKVGDFRLGFPLDLTLKEVCLSKNSTDTLMAVEALHLKVGLSQIFRKQLEVNGLELQGAHLELSNDTSGMRLRVRLKDLSLAAHKIDLKELFADIGEIRLKGGEVFLNPGNVREADTVTSGPLPGWTFNLGRITLENVDYQMSTMGLPYLGAGLTTGYLAGGKVVLAQQSVSVDSVGISGGWCRLQPGNADPPGAVSGKADSLVTEPWMIRAGSVMLDNSAFSLEKGKEEDMQIALSGIGVQMDSVYNRGTVVKALLKDLKAVQKNGIVLEKMQAEVELDTALTALEGGYIRTANSRIYLNAYAATAITGLMTEAPLSVQMNGQLGLADVKYFYADLPGEIAGNRINVNTSFTISEKRLQLGQLILDMPGHFKITGSGSITDFKDVNRMRGNLVLRGVLPDISFVKSCLGETGVNIPYQMDMLARLKANRGQLDAEMRLCCGDGCLSLDGTYQLQSQAYDGNLVLTAFPLYRFLPADSLGQVSAGMRFSGSSFSWSQAKAEMNAHIDHFDYRRHDYRDIRLELYLTDTHLKGSLESKDPDALVDLVFKADSVGNEYALNVLGRVGYIRLDALHFTEEPLSIRADIDLEAAMGTEDTYRLDARLDSLNLTDANRNYLLGNLDFGVKSDREETTLDFNSGDMNLEFHADTSLSEFVNHISSVEKIIEKQWTEREINMQVIRQNLPPFSLQVSAEKKNAVARFLKTRNIGYRDLFVDIVSRKRSGIRVGFQVNAPYFGNVRLDSVQLGAWQTGRSLMYSLTAGSSAENWKGLFNVNVTGRMQGDQFRVELKQKNLQGQVGFDLGANLVFGDSTLALSLFPMTPILGYSRWIVNADNRIIISREGKINANLRMAYQHKLVSVQSLADEGDRKDRLRVELAGIDLQALSQMMPFMPDLSGNLNTELMLYSGDNSMGADGDIRITELGYNGQRIGTVDFNLEYEGKERFTRHAVGFELKIDSIRRAIAKGVFYTSDVRKDLNVDVDIPSLPLYVVNAFVPSDILRLSGDLQGAVRFRGTMNEPDLNGELSFREGRTDLAIIGTSFSMDTSRLLIDNGKILFRKYRFAAPNKSALILDGNITLTPFDRMSVDLAADADDFEVVNVRKNETSLIYGKAYADIHSRISGLFSALSVSGNINLLNRTAITYVLRSSDPQLVDKSADVVRFVSFRDTTLNEKDDLTNRAMTSSFALRMMIEIGDQVSVGVDLSEDGSDHITIQGGGNLVLGMNPESGMVLSGKYIVSGGTVIYNVPIVGKKEFSIRSGSYVEWTGNVMNPVLSISASEAVKANVDDGEQPRQVNFEAIIRIQNTLSRPGITFDLSAPNDMVIQNQLATFSPEERTRQALNLLIYNTYTAPGAAKSSTGGNMANNALYSLVENELNKYTQKAGLTVGFDSHNTDENTTRTDVTYQFSRQLFNDRVRVKIGGRISTDGNEGQSNSLQDNLVDDISIEYVLTRKRNLFVKVFRHSNYESVLDGEVVQTGIGIVWRKNFRKFKDLFKNKNREERLKRKKAGERD